MGVRDSRHPRKTVVMCFFGISLLCVFLKLPVSRRKTGHVKRFHFLQVQAPWPHISGSPKKLGMPMEREQSWVKVM